MQWCRSTWLALHCCTPPRCEQESRGAQETWPSEYVRPHGHSHDHDPSHSHSHSHSPSRRPRPSPSPSPSLSPGPGLSPVLVPAPTPLLPWPRPSQVYDTSHWGAGGRHRKRRKRMVNFSYVQ